MNNFKKYKSQYYKNDIEYIEDQFKVIDLLMEKKQIKNFEDDDSLAKNHIKKINRQISKQRSQIYRKKKYSNINKKSFCFDGIVNKYKLNNVEANILIFLLYRYFTTDNQGTSGRTILENITNNRLHMMKSRYYLMENGQLIKNNLIACTEGLDNESILDSEFYIPENLISKILGENHREKNTQKEQLKKTYRNYLNLHFFLFQMLEKKAEVLSIIRSDNGGPIELEYSPVAKGSSRELKHIYYNIRKYKNQIKEYHEDSQSYPVEQVQKKYELDEDEKLLLIILLYQSLGLNDSYAGSEGKALLALISDSENEIIAKRSLLYKESKLRNNDLIEVEKAWEGQNILDAEYFLSEEMIRRLLDDLNREVKKKENVSPAENDSQTLYKVKPKFSFDDVIISDEKKETIKVALSQEINHKLISETWGFGKKIPYGTALTMLFSGHPGTGKTMMAEAIAHTLKRDLLIANYAQIQNFYVGETEKRIVATFKKARKENGVLLWDEADAMFYSRDSANHSWENRDINVILQEMEKFSGVVILTTNRKIALDKALDRRISVKVNFEIPTARERKKIWQTLMPKKAPLSEKIDFEYLAENYELTGGMIKNALLHAARYAAYQKAKNITMEYLTQGIKMQKDTSWTLENKIGFSRV